MLMKSVPGIPGEDYPIFAAAPETAFSCDGQVNGGKFSPAICIRTLYFLRRDVKIQID